MNTSTHTFLIILLIIGFLLYGFGSLRDKPLISVFGVSVVIMSLSSFAIDLDSVYRNQICSKDAIKEGDENNTGKIKSSRNVILSGLIVSTLFLFFYIMFKIIQNRKLIKGNLDTYSKDLISSLKFKFY